MRRPFWILITLALLNGLVYVFLVPPWQHYDEPNHFEYVWLAAHRPGWPQEGDFDPEMRRATLRSMIAHDFFRGMGGHPEVDAEIPWIGAVPQVGDPPLYYWLAAWPLRFFAPLDILPQLYAARLVSLALFLLTVFLAWETAALLAPEGSPLRWMTPAFMAALPPFADIMTAVNNDVAAVAVFALFLYAATRLVQRGWRWREGVLLAAAAVLSLLAKRTVFFAPLLLPVALLFAFLRGRRARRAAWGLLAALMLLGGAAALRGGDAALWYRRTPQAEGTRAETAAAPLGDYALRLRAEARGPRRQALQLLPAARLAGREGELFTLGAWMWASAPVEVPAPRLVLVGRGALPLLEGAPKAALTEQPRFYVWRVRLPDTPVRRAWVQFGAPAAAHGGAVDIFVDGAVLAAGAFPLDAPPRWQDAQAQRGVWGDAPVENLLRNASAERGWLSPRPWVDALWSRVFGYTSEQFASLVAYTLRDAPGAGWYYRTVGATLFRSFWGRFGWGHVPLLGRKPYRPLLGATAVLLAGFAAGVWRARKGFPWAAGAVYLLALAAAWGLTLVRGAHHVLSGWVNIPVARYGFPALFPLAAGLALGAHTLGRLPPIRRLAGALWGAFLAGLTLWAWASVFAFYYR